MQAASYVITIAFVILLTSPNDQDAEEVTKQLRDVFTRVNRRPDDTASEHEEKRLRKHPHGLQREAKRIRGIRDQVLRRVRLNSSVHVGYAGPLGWLVKTSQSAYPRGHHDKFTCVRIAMQRAEK
jgi:hypothetical protein